MVGGHSALSIAPLGGTCQEKYLLPGGRGNYHLAQRIFNRFSSLKQAEAYDRSLNDLKEAMKKGGRRGSRPPATGWSRPSSRPQTVTAGKSCGSSWRRLQWRISEVYEWLQVEELEVTTSRS